MLEDERGSFPWSLEPGAWSLISSLTDPKPLAGLFVGGRASRMHGIAKGLLSAPDGEPIVTRTLRIFEDVGVSCVLVGAHPAYAQLGLEMLTDDPEAEGPLAGLLALLCHAGARRAIAVACDMPLLTRDLVRRLVDAPPAAIVAPRHVTVGERDAPMAGRCDATRHVWEPLFARYDAPVVLPIARAFAKDGGRKLQVLLDRAGADPLPLTSLEEEMLVDWDAPEDVERSSRIGASKKQNGWQSTAIEAERQHLPRGAARGRRET